MAPKPKVSDSQLTTEQMKLIDDLIVYLNDHSVMDETEIKRRSKVAIRSAFEEMDAGGLNYGQAIGFPVSFPEDPIEHRQFMKAKDQNFEWQCEITEALFNLYVEKGEDPAPHYPNRILVLLRKAKDFDRERDFVSAWRRHFPEIWREHAAKIGAADA